MRGKVVAAAAGAAFACILYFSQNPFLLVRCDLAVISDTRCTVWCYFGISQESHVIEDVCVASSVHSCAAG